ncbi:MAG: LysR family transcriptional regulator [Kangiellaceae bacterium]|nr:LysR family transcriptional regulator [Kangiellaceae bacterium]
MKLIEVRSFLEIVSLESFSKAATSLHYAHSSVTAQIKSLESHLGEQLFIRDNKKVTITEAGKRFLPFARQLIELSRDAKSATHSTPVLAGELTLAAVETISTYRLPQVLKTFQQVAPNVHLTFKVMRDQEIYESVKNGTIDLGFMVEEKLIVRDVETRELCPEPISIFAHPDHPLATKEKVSIAELANEYHLLWALGCSYSDLVNEIMQQAGYHDYRSMEFSNTETMKQCVLENMGLATLTDITVNNEVMASNISRINFDLPQRFNSFMLYNTHRAENPLIQQFIQIVDDCFR